MDDPRIIIVMLRQPKRYKPSEMRTDPLWEFGSFGCTRCHRGGLMNPNKLAELNGTRFAFAQNGPLARISHRWGQFGGEGRGVAGVGLGGGVDGWVLELEDDQRRVWQAADAGGRGARARLSAAGQQRRGPAGAGDRLRPQRGRAAARSNA